VRPRLCIALIALLSIGLAACGEDDNEDWAPPLHPTVREEVNLKPCRVPSGGYDVRVSKLNCEQAVEIVDRLGRGGPLRATEASVAFDRGNGWTCWADLLKEFGPIQNVCWRGQSLIVYKAG
jgi:hypothetical protein